MVYLSGVRNNHPRGRRFLGGAPHEQHYDNDTHNCLTAYSQEEMPYLQVAGEEVRQSTASPDDQGRNSTDYGY